MGFAKKITAHVRRDTGKHLVYPPGVPLSLGDVVVKDDGVWTPIANLYDDLDIKRDFTFDADADEDWQPTSERGFDMNFKLAGKPGDGFKHLLDAEAGVKIDLEGEAAFALAMSGVRFNRIASIPAFWDEVRDKRSWWTWDWSYRIVTHVVECETATFLASAGRSASFELVAEAGVDVANIKLADISTGLSFKSTMSAKDRFVAKKGATPLFGAYKRKILRGQGPADFSTAENTLPEIEIEPDLGGPDEEE